METADETNLEMNLAKASKEMEEKVKPEGLKN